MYVCLAFESTFNFFLEKARSPGFVGPPEHAKVLSGAKALLLPPPLHHALRVTPISIVYLTGYTLPPEYK